MVKEKLLGYEVKDLKSIAELLGLDRLSMHEYFHCSLAACNRCISSKHNSLIFALCSASTVALNDPDNFSLI